MEVSTEVIHRHVAGESQTLARPRLLWPDLARTAALAGMVVFHFTYDLELFGLVASGTTRAGFWAVFSRAVAGAFLFLSGISLVLAHGRGFRPKAWAKRFVLLCVAAALVTAATYAVFPSRFVYFGILHAIAAASLIGLLFLRVLAWGTLAAAAAILIIDAVAGRSVFTSPWLVWTGLGSVVRPAMDFIPMVPWLAPYLAGIAAARLAGERLYRSGRSGGRMERVLAWPGRNSLAVYLLHQPLLLGLAWLVAAGARAL